MTAHQLAMEGRLEHERREREAERARAAERAREDAAIASEIERNPGAGYTRLIEVLAKRHRIEVEWVDRLPEGVAGSSSQTARRVQLYKLGTIEDVEASVATALHECGHVVAGPCPQVAGHYRDPAARGHWSCLRCEEEAWATALTLWPFTAGMYARMRAALQQRQRKTAAPAYAQTKAHELAGRGWAEDRQRRVAHAHRLQKQRLAAAQQARDLATLTAEKETRR